MKNNTTFDLSIALQYAKDRHGGQMYGDKPYILHLVQVLNNCQELDLNMDCQIIAVLHDVLEDTCSTPKEFFDVYNEIKEMFGFEVANVASTLSHDKSNESYSEYLCRVIQNALALDVKFCDVLANLEESILSNDNRRIRKYKKALFELGGAFR